MIDFILLSILILCAVTIVYVKDLISTTIILGAYSFIMSAVWVRLNAVDVAFTEACVGAGITTVLLIAAISRIKEKQSCPAKSYDWRTKLSLLIVFITGAMLIYGTIDMPDFGDFNSPPHTHVTPRYIQNSYQETGAMNFVTAVLASYRGYDTLGETTVIFTAGICIALLLKKNER